MLPPVSTPQPFSQLSKDTHAPFHLFSHYLRQDITLLLQSPAGSNPVPKKANNKNRQKYDYDNFHNSLQIPAKNTSRNSYSIIHHKPPGLAPLRRFCSGLVESSNRCHCEGYCNPSPIPFNRDCSSPLAMTIEKQPNTNKTWQGPGESMARTWQ